MHVNTCSTSSMASATSQLVTSLTILKSRVLINKLYLTTITRRSQAISLVHKRDIVRLGRSLITCHRKPDQNSVFKAASARIVEVDVIDPKTRETITIYGTMDVVNNNAGSRVVVTLKRMRSEASSEHIQELDPFTIPLSPLG